MKKILLLLVGLGLFLPTLGQHKLPPKYTNFSLIVDDANLLDSTQEATLSEYINQRQAGAISIIILICDIKKYGFAEPVDLAVSYFNTYGIGKKGANNGLLILHDPVNRKVFINTGTGLEGMLTDYACNHIVDAIKPFLKQADWEGAYRTATDLIMENVTKEAPLEQQRNAVEKSYEEAQNQEGGKDFGEFGIVLILLLLLILGIIFLSYLPVLRYRFSLYPRLSKEIQQIIARQITFFQRQIKNSSDMAPWLEKKRISLLESFLQRIPSLEKRLRDLEKPGISKIYRAHKELTELVVVAKKLDNDYEQEVIALKEYGAQIVSTIENGIPHLLDRIYYLSGAAAYYEKEGFACPLVAVSDQTYPYQEVPEILRTFQNQLSELIPQDAEGTLDQLKQWSNALHDFLAAEKKVAEARECLAKGQQYRKELVEMEARMAPYRLRKEIDITGALAALDQTDPKNFTHTPQQWSQAHEAVYRAESQLESSHYVLNLHQQNKQTLAGYLTDGTKPYALLYAAFMKEREVAFPEYLPESCRETYTLHPVDYYAALIQTAQDANQLEVQDFEKAAKALEELKMILDSVEPLIQKMRDAGIAFKEAKTTALSLQQELSNYLTTVNQWILHSDVSSSTQTSLKNWIEQFQALNARIETEQQPDWFTLDTALKALITLFSWVQQAYERDLSRAEQQRADARSSSSSSSSDNYSSNNDGGRTSGGGAGGSY